MMSLPRKSWLIYSFIISCYYPLVKTNIGTWMNHLKRHFEEDKNFYQIIIFSEKQKPTFLISKELVRNIPTLRLSLRTLSNPTKSNFLSLPSFGEPRSTTLFIMITNFDEETYISKVQKFVEFIQQISPIRSLPKCLIIFVQKENFNYRNLLYEIWIKRILDITILQLVEIDVSKKNIFLVPNNLRASVHHYNPFTDVYFSENLVSPTSEKLNLYGKIPVFQNWFPNKVRDMNGYQIKAGLIHKPPHSFVTRNSTGHPINCTGADIYMFKALSEALNFTYFLHPSNVESLGVINQTTNCANGFIGKLLQHEINLIVNNMVRSKSPKYQHWEYSNTIEVESLKALVPILPAKKRFFNRRGVYLTVVCFVLITIFVWIVSRLLRFDPHFWQQVDVIQMLLGNGTSRAPIRIAERILFMSLLIVSFVNVTILYAGFTSFRLISDPKMKIDSFYDLDKAGLTPVILRNFFSLTFGLAEGSIFNLGKKTIKWDGDEIVTECPKILVKYKNVTCLLTSSVAEALVATYFLEVKIVEPSFWSCGTAIAFEKGSPYVDQFNKIMIRIQEAGLRGKWSRQWQQNKIKFDNQDGDNVRDYDDADDENDYEYDDTTHKGSRISSKTLRKKGLYAKINSTLIFIVLGGGVISFTAFIIEVLCNYLTKLVDKKRLTC